MAVYQVDPIFEGNNGKRNSTWQRTYTLSYRVWCDNSYDGPVTIREATVTKIVGGQAVNVPWLPYIGVYYYPNPAANVWEYDLGALVIDEDYQFEELVPPANGQSRPGCTWICKYTYGPYDGAAFGPDPCLWPIRLKFSGQPYQKIIYVDANGNPILNSALCPYQDPVQVDDSRSIITVTRNEPLVAYAANGASVSAFDPTASASYRDTVNVAAWNGFDAKAVKCNKIETGDEQWDSNGQRYYYEVSYEFQINDETWQLSILDQGKQVLDSSGEPTPLLTAEGQVIDEPVLLNGAGAELPKSGTPVFGTWDGYDPVDFSAFNMDFTKAIGRI